MKVGNFGRLDPTLRAQGIVGLRHGAKMEKEVWHEFMANPDEMAIKSEEIIAELKKRHGTDLEKDILKKQPIGEDRKTTTKQRIGQEFFRNVVLSSYNNHCCVSGIGNSELLEACHIIDWSKDKANRTNPQNGLCLNVFFHRAYDKYLFAITPDYEIVISDKLVDNTVDEGSKTYLMELKGKQISLPDHFLPKKEFLEEHYSSYKHNQ